MKLKKKRKNIVMTIIITCTRTEPQNKRKQENMNTAILQQLEISKFRINSTTATTLCGVADDRLFAKIENNKFHVLYNCLPSKKETGYNMRKRKHSFLLPIKDNRNFINRFLFKNI